MGFKALTVNTPAEEPAHILAEDDAALYEGLFGADRVLNIGNKLNASVITNNKVRISDGVAVVGGHVGRIVKGDYEDLTIENGVSGQKRNDLIVARFQHGGTDTYKLAVVKGVSGSTGVDPNIVQGNLYAGEPQRDYPLWRVRLDGLSIVKVEQMYEISRTNKDLTDTIDELNSKLKFDTVNLGSYNIAAANQQNVNVAYTPPSGYTVVGFTPQLPVRYVAAIRYTGGTFNGVLYNVSNGSGNYSVNVMVILVKL